MYIWEGTKKKKASFRLCLHDSKSNFEFRVVVTKIVRGQIVEHLENLTSGCLEIQSFIYAFDLFIPSIIHSMNMY